MATLVASLLLLVVAAVFFHGQGGGVINLPTRVITTGFIAGLIGVLTFAAWGCWVYALIGAVSAGFAFCWGPEIGWNKDVLRTQIIKGAWLTASFFPFGLFYAATRPLAYWIGYTKFTSSQDEIARFLSGCFLAITCAAVYEFAEHQLLAERLGEAARAASSLFLKEANHA